MIRPIFSILCWLVLVLGTLVAPASAQVPQHGTFTGRLVNDLGTPLAGPVDLELRIFDAPTAGTEIYAELHTGVPLDPTGSFAVQFGSGTPLRTTLPPDSGAADLFAEPPRWVEVVVDDEVLTPREVVGAVAWALIAQQANKIVRDPNAPRFEDCGDGTVADHKTGLQWEKKTGTVGSSVVCETTGCPDPHDVNNVYAWSDSLVEPDGNAFTDFLARLNDEFNHVLDPAGCFADHCDWRLPKIRELQRILIGEDASPGQASTCESSPCIDPEFAEVAGPTDPGDSYWSSNWTGDPTATYEYGAAFCCGGQVINSAKTTDHLVRAVRTGSCN